MKGYKAFKKGMICLGKQYQENTVFEEDKAEICNSGMHFCKNPLDVLGYYPLVDENGDISEFAEVEALDECKTNDDKKFCTKKLKIGAKISFPQLVQASVEFDYSNAQLRPLNDNGGYYARIGSSWDSARIGSIGDSARIGSSGDYARIGSSGYSARIGSSGDSAQIGSSGYSARIGSSGDYARIGSSGYSARIGSSGDYARIGSSGDSARIGSSGDSARIISNGDCSVVCCSGHGSCVKAKKGSWITLSEWEYDAQKEKNIPVCVKSVQVDGVKIKEDTFYCLENGEFVECED